jgi:alpha-galactosidase
MDPSVTLTWDTNKFPLGLTNTVRLIHERGYKAYLYTEPNPITSAGYTGSYNNLEADAQMFADWGFDGVKLDQPSGSYGDSQRMIYLETMMAAFRAAAPGRSVVFWSSGWMATNAQLIASAPTGSIIRYGYGFADWSNEGYPPNDWYGVYLNFLKRIDSYITLDLLHANGPGHSFFTEAALNNSPIGRPICSMWAMLAAPLIFSELVATPEQIQNATDPEIYDIDQDPLYLAAQPVQTNDTQMVWVKPLADDSVAVALLNRTRDVPQDIGFTWEQIGLKNSRPATVRDV